MLELFPNGFEEVERADGVELAAYGDAHDEGRVFDHFDGARSDAIEPGWEERWKAYHRGVAVGSLWIGPPWETAPPGRQAVKIDPGRAFGTGAHPTTRLALELLELARPASLLDIGCGSGVLAIAAAKLGCTRVLALDADAAAVEATARNASANGVAVEVRQADALTDALPAVDVAVANIARDVVEAVASRLDCRRLVTSGYLTRELPAIPGYVRVERRTEGEWAADMFERE
jgi:ribosomal protein L11 methyltransferase